MSEVRAKKALGQHFLVDLNIARKVDSLSGGEIRLRTAPAVAALPGADGQAAAGRGPEEPEDGRNRRSEKRDPETLPRGAQRPEPGRSQAMDGQRKLQPGWMSLRVPGGMLFRGRNRMPGGMLRRRQGRRVCRV